MQIEPTPDKERKSWLNCLWATSRKWGVTRADIAITGFVALWERDIGTGKAVKLDLFIQRILLDRVNLVLFAAADKDRRWKGDLHRCLPYRDSLLLRRQIDSDELLTGITAMK